NVHVTSLPAVQLAAGNQVGIDPAANTVRDADQPARHPFQAQKEITTDLEEMNPVPLFTVPAGKRAVIETGSASVATPVRERGSARLSTTVGGFGTTFYFIEPPLAGTFFRWIRASPLSRYGSTRIQVRRWA